MNPLISLVNLPSAEKDERGIAHTPAEILQQPSTWISTWAHIEARMPEIQAFLSAVGLTAASQDRPTVYLIGAGTSDYIGHCLHHLLRQKWQCEVVPVASTDLLIDFSEYILEDRPYLWISFSRSGDSPEGVAVLERALAENPQISHLVVSCNASGQMSQLIKGKAGCFGIVLDEETNDQGLAMTSSFTNMVIAGQVLAHAWSAAEYEPIVKSLSEAAQAFLPLAAELAEHLATKGYRRACFIGSGPAAGTAQESALKLLELTAGRTKTMSQSTLGLRHGPMAALDHDTLLVSFLSTQSTRQRYEIDLLREIERKQLVGASLAVIGSGMSGLPQLESTQVLAPQNHWQIPDSYRPAVDVLFGQVLGLFFSLGSSLRPDSPSPNGAISRVVQPIEIY
ncbi:tagatose-6-phosphate ketose/aldose isomerase [Silvibacterium bohemicum]|uniref:Tagatose-6-phosphate ketose/aldose isomerase n=1 Tax=Silvibacterium bohemicum TaxID=1577686 RepID=A0A841JSG2_9BACT|nr:SIS domain-containing protein [Silvibacterium bohemicum]MBB6144246.1 tagatose-6-phosphate ketose/aldose isomerase [Silvibacterium bohemicum]